MTQEHAWIFEEDMLTKRVTRIALQPDGQLPGAVAFSMKNGEGLCTYTLTHLPRSLSWRDTLRVAWKLRLWRCTSLPVYMRTMGVTAVCWTCREAVGHGTDHAAAELKANMHKLDHGDDHLTLLLPDEVADENPLGWDDIEARTVGELREACGVKLNPRVKISDES